MDQQFYEKYILGKKRAGVFMTATLLTKFIDFYHCSLKEEYCKSESPGVFCVGCLGIISQQYIANHHRSDLLPLKQVFGVSNELSHQVFFFKRRFIDIYVNRLYEMRFVRVNTKKEHEIRMPWINSSLCTKIKAESSISKPRVKKSIFANLSAQVIPPPVESAVDRIPSPSLLLKKRHPLKTASSSTQTMTLPLSTLRELIELGLAGLMESRSLLTGLDLKPRLNNSLAAELVENAKNQQKVNSSLN